MLDKSPKVQQSYSLIPGNEGEPVAIKEVRNRRTVIGAALVIIIAVAFGARQLLKKLYGEENISSINITNRYPKISSLSYYSWDNVVEPNKETTLSIGLSSTNSACIWKITLNGNNVGKSYGCGDVKHTFTSVSGIYTISVEINGVILTEQAVCKYVRREIRTLTKYDRTTYFSALQLIHRLTLQEGQAQFGDNFKNYAYFTSKHLDAWTENDCFPLVGPFHGSNAFLTSHAAFTLELEQALQAIDPSLSQPYWDFTVDAELGLEWTNSDLFGYDYFGSISPPGHVVNDSKYFSYLPSPFDADSDYLVENSYGKLTNAVNQDSSPYLTRGGPAVCSADVNSVLPGSDAFEACDVWATLTDWRSCIEVTVHAYVHTIVGGAWSCPYSLSNFPQLDIRTLIALNAINIWKLAENGGMLTCPDTCSSSTPLDECRCSCSSSSEGMDEVLEFLYLTVTAWDTYAAVQPIISKSDGVYSFIGLSATESDELMDKLATFACAPGVLGAMGTDAAANDPFFWSLHLLYEQAWAKKRIQGELGVEEWVDLDDQCAGANPSDLMPFDFTASGYMSNLELYDYFDPSNQQLPYIYDAFQ